MGRLDEIAMTLQEISLRSHLYFRPLSVTVRARLMSDMLD